MFDIVWLPEGVWKYWRFDPARRSKFRVSTSKIQLQTMLLNRTLDLYISCWKVCVDQTALFELGEPCALNHLTLFVKYAPMVPLFRSSPKRITTWSKCMICGFRYFWLNSTPWNTPQVFHELISSLWFHSWKSIPWIGVVIPDDQNTTFRVVESPHGRYCAERNNQICWPFTAIKGLKMASFGEQWAQKLSANHSESFGIPRQGPMSFPWKWPMYSDIRIETFETQT